MKKFLAVMLSGFTVAGFLLVSSVFAQTAASPKASTTPSVAAKAERHPEIHAAIRKLRRAKEDLEKAAHDYAGHRIKAIQLIDQALEELKAALQSDKQ